ncbi:hypothetical protein AJ79_07552 [Helicocarpus griseus UAMH5409]|uniref:Choline kinase N-terminal domain-containing protein n=1 Tax=Helicocarpus griseus UAMH5409 TaxID=1447875 RepID=A0A2B7X1Z7_9EURO|nr:hypothetical protein AJ79_07552 [Helicocarpus griseus UAMH5409]
MSPIADDDVPSVTVDSKELGGVGETDARVEPFTPKTPMNGDSHAHHGTESRPHRQHRASVGRKVTARQMPHVSSAPLNLLSSQLHSLRFESVIQDDEESDHRSRISDESYHAQRSLLSQVFDWLQHEKSKSTARRRKKTDTSPYPVPDITSADGSYTLTRERSDSQSSEGTLALEKLEQILAQYAAASGKEGLSPAVIGRKGSSSSSKRRAAGIKGLRRGSTSDSDYSEADHSVPSADVVLDNSKTLLYGGGEADNDIGSLSLNKPAKEKEHWIIFKSEIVRLTHTLGFKGWKRVPIEDCSNVEVIRLSGALTNAVYVVSPPKNLPRPSNSSSSSSLALRRPPPQLLLRIYGPQVEHLIDRENELQILRRLAKRNIGPRVLGTFNNGRFEEYFHAKTLTPSDIRNPETSKKIAKRMRELHDGIELLREEREGGPFIWKNWDKWVERCEQVASRLDSEIESPHNQVKFGNEAWRRQGYVCGAPWPKFRKLVESYRKWLDDCYGGTAEINQRLVFAHNDTQYGNLLRLEPSGESPLLLPANEHKQLVVIDFEYASANTRGLEFCNHFTEWCYNYHDPERPWACNTRWYPTPEEQERFIRSYIKHRPRLAPPTENHSSQSAPASSSPLSAAHANSPRLSPFMLDSQVPPFPSLGQDGGERTDPALELEVRHLLRETRLWRAANSAQWAAWGIVQAKVVGMEEALAAATSGADEQPAATATEEKTENGSSPALSNAASDQSSESVEQSADEFDYLAYAQDRALFFWADVLSLGLIRENELPADMAERIKGHVIGY